ncbi:rhotekin isoform X2 [Fundulus heteroclitus]|uniref:rhotekin isoform X2 n=1 Tax=Fundulus heteroclitus TaxID=8078 RepID=UPI00165C2130|nr:rhotekin isoform X2 [Fundulus heteroclitus]
MVHASYSRSSLNTGSVSCRVFTFQPEQTSEAQLRAAMADRTQDEKVLQRIEREVRMQEGAYKLLAACSQRDQALEASKSLLTCNTRILALLSQLQRIRKAQILERAGHRMAEDAVPCTGKVSISNLRIPLMWKDSEYFKNKGELHRCAVFCLLQCGTEIHDTVLVMVDRTLTDICFEDTIIFNKVDPGFQIRTELYSCSLVEDFSPPAPAPRRMGFLGGSLGCSSGKKIRAALESAAACSYVSSDGGNSTLGHVPSHSLHQSALGPKFHLLAHTTLSIEHVREGFKTHDLVLSATEDSPFWLPLYGNMCCRLVAQPQCMIQSAISGRLEVKLEEDVDHWENFYCILMGRSLLCYRSQEDLEPQGEPSLVIPITKDTRVCISESDHVQRIIISIQSRPENVTYTATTNSTEDLQHWNKALCQHVYNLSLWKQCSDEVMKIGMQRPRKTNPTKPGSLYHEIAINHLDRETADSRQLHLFFLPVVFKSCRNGQEDDKCCLRKFFKDTMLVLLFLLFVFSLHTNLEPH